MTNETLTIAALINDLQASPAANARKRGPFVTGFHPLDEALNGGLRMQDLTLVGGKPGVGKTIATLQWARNMVLDGASAIFACYEHTAQHLLARLLLMELGSLARQESLSDYDELLAAIQDFSWGYRPLEEIPDARGLLGDAVGCLRSYSDRLWLLPASGAHTDLAALTGAVEAHGNGRTVLFVDYLQKVAMIPEPETEVEKVTRVAEGLKDLAMEHNCAVVALTASIDEGLTAHRQRLHHMRGGTALAYEADLVVMLNDKIDAVSKVHLAYDGVRAETFKHQVVFSIEKNRGGPAGLDMDFRKDFAHARFDPAGSWVTERLVDERVMAE